MFRRQRLPLGPVLRREGRPDVAGPRYESLPRFNLDPLPSHVNPVLDHIAERVDDLRVELGAGAAAELLDRLANGQSRPVDRKSTRLNSSHTVISYAVFCLKKKKK